MESFGINTRNIRWSSVLNMHHLSPAVKTHLARLHTAVAVSTLTFATMVYTTLTYMPWLSSISQAVTFITALMIVFSGNRKDLPTFGRVALLFTLAGSMGCSLAPYIGLLFDAGMGDVVVAAAAGSLSVFVALSFAAMVAPSRQFLLMGGALMSGLFYLSLMSLFNMFFRSSLLLSVDMYLGLLLFFGYVLFDTQLAIADAEMGDRDYVRHAVDLFLDLVNIFVRILAILLKEKKQK